ncbi:MAG: PqiC family protein [Steroidobacteraceae bacterium]
MNTVRRLLFILPFLLVGCAAAPPLRLYTLGAPGASDAFFPPAPGAQVIEVSRINLPDYLDTQDLLVRRGSVIERSDTGRWISRLSVLATDLVTQQLAMRTPRAWVTDEEVAGSPNYRIIIDVSELDITAKRTATLAASWQVIPDNGGPVVRCGRSFTLSGSIATDQSVVRLERRLFDRLARAITIPD